MQQLKHILFSLIIVFTLYATGMLALKKVTYKQKPIIYITNNYYTWKGGDTYEKFKAFNENQKHDVIIVGSSRAYRGYSPILFNEFGYNSFNLGTSAQTIKNTYFTVKHFISKENCNLLVIDVFSGAFLKSQLESTSDLIENVSKPKAAYDIAFNSYDVRALNMSVLRCLTENDLPYFRNNEKSIKGYSSKQDSMSVEKKEMIYLKKKIDHSALEIDKEQIDYFNKLLTYCKNKSIKAVCVYSPVSYFYNHEQHQKFMEMIGPIMSNNNVPFYDFKDIEKINSVDHFYDDSHLNQAGVEIFNKALIQKLQDDKLLKKNESN